MVEKLPAIPVLPSIEQLTGFDIIMLDTSPHAAAEILKDRLPKRQRRAYQAYRFGPGAFKVDFVIRGHIPWTHKAARQAGTVHLGGTLSQIAATEKQAVKGNLYECPFVLVGHSIWRILAALMVSTILCGLMRMFLKDTHMMLLNILCGRLSVMRRDFVTLLSIQSRILLRRWRVITKIM